MPITLKFMQAIERAVQRFVKEYEPLSESNLHDVNVIKLALTFRDQTDLILRDALRERCALINNQWRHWLFSSRLTIYIEEVLSNPEFQIEKLYENKITDLEAQIITLVKQIETVTAQLPSYVNDLQVELTSTQQQRNELSEKLKGNQEYIKKLEELIKRHEMAYQQLETRYGKLHGEYLRILTKNSTRVQSAPRKVPAICAQKVDYEMEAFPKVLIAKS